MAIRPDPRRKLDEQLEHLLGEATRERARAESALADAARNVQRLLDQLDPETFDQPQFASATLAIAEAHHEWRLAHGTIAAIHKARHALD